MSGAQAPRLRVPLAGGRLMATPEMPSEDLIPSLLPFSDDIGTGWFVTRAAGAQPGTTVVVVGDGAVGLPGVFTAEGGAGAQPDGGIAGPPVTHPDTATSWRRAPPGGSGWWS